MSRTSAPTLRRNYSSSDGSCVDPYDKAEQGLQINSEDLSAASPPLAAKKTLSYRSSLRSSDSTLVGFPSHEDIVDDLRTPLPCQGQRLCTPTWTTRWFTELSRLSFPRSISEKAPEPPPTDLLPGYEQFQFESYDKYPNGLPRVAAFLESCDSFSIYRRFSHAHSRLLVTHQRNITDLETQLKSLDKSDDEVGPDVQPRWKTRDEFDAAKRDLEEKLEKQLLAYDALLLNHHRLKSLDATPTNDHHSVFKWIWKTKPLGSGECNWIFHPGDFVSMVSPQRNQFENTIHRYLHYSSSPLKNFFRSASRVHETEDSSVEFFSQTRISTVARLVAVFFAVSILFIPVILFLLVSMSRACMLAVVLVFVLAFSIIISVVVEVSFQEIFIGTAGYCAVLATFLGNLGGATAG